MRMAIAGCGHIRFQSVSLRGIAARVALDRALPQQGSRRLRAEKPAGVHGDHGRQLGHRKIVGCFGRRRAGRPHHVRGAQPVARHGSLPVQIGISRQGSLAEGTPHCLHRDVRDRDWQTGVLHRRRQSRSRQSDLQSGRQARGHTRCADPDRRATRRRSYLRTHKGKFQWQA